MANQPKKYKKFVATAATATLVASAIVPVASAANLSDISGNTHEEAINALVDAKVISGYPDGTFKPNKALTRSDVVKLLGKYLETEGYEPASNWKTSPAFADLKTTSNEELLKYASVVKEAGVFVGSNGNLLPSDLITRENMAITLVRMINTLEDVSLEEFVAGEDFKGDVKDLNAAKAEARSAISVLDFYDITNPAVSEFNPKGNTTRGQFASFLYKTVSTDFSKVPTNEASEVVPEKVEVVERSIQGKFGENVTVQVKVTTKAGESAANIPVTLAINPAGVDQLLQEQIKEEVLTNAEGVATYTYTRYDNKNQSFTDTVVAYASAKTGVRSSGAIHWGQSLEIKDVTEKVELADGEQKVYQISGAKNRYLFVTFQENLNVSPDKAQDAQVLGLGGYAGNGAYTTSFSGKVYEYTTGGSQVALIRLDANGKANLTITGKNATVTPVVYDAGSSTTQPVEAASYSATALQAKGTTSKFTAEALYDLTIAAEGKQEAADYAGTTETGGRDYVVTLKDKAGKALSNAEVKIGFSKATGTANPVNDVYVIEGKTSTKVTGDGAFVTVTTDKDGKAKFTVTGAKDEFVTPVAFIGNSLTDNRIKKSGEITYFRTVYASDYTSVLNISDNADADNKATSKIGEGKTAKFTYQLSDQNGKARSYTAATEVTFTVRAGSQPVTIAGEATELAPYEYRTVKVTLPAGSKDASLLVTAAKASEVSVTATATSNGLSGLTSITKSVEFISGATTSAFDVTIASKVADTATADIASVTLTFTETVNRNDLYVSAPLNATVGTTSNDKQLVVYFNTPKVSENGTFTVYYKGKGYTFQYTGGKLVLQPAV
ncbi:S-layer homology domain-containing protein [Metasolibacillus sp.]|uniref:S-layer homology domain-containing protein n=1 Tax=Metasolibacillus sp. TaxID=2703680 RepID=UPI0025E01EB6|nr:S-layer homology domain-containing protein [Metasolibacillus sp.]MCT6923393.1 S-layer homology domain-containing protein [Metasolibacillus sp.]MCT6939884.1 S-layer homology domain-containing protein [Metasolibacillus sp.]